MERGVFLEGSDITGSESELNPFGNAFAAAQFLQLLFEFFGIQTGINLLRRNRRLMPEHLLLILRNRNPGYRDFPAIKMIVQGLQIDGLERLGKIFQPCFSRAELRIRLLKQSQILLLQPILHLLAAVVLGNADKTLFDEFMFFILRCRIDPLQRRQVHAEQIARLILLKSQWIDIFECGNFRHL